jgi:hypothetical protein
MNKENRDIWNKVLFCASISDWEIYEFPNYDNVRSNRTRVSKSPITIVLNEYKDGSIEYTCSTHLVNGIGGFYGKSFCSLQEAISNCIHDCELKSPRIWYSGLVKKTLLQIETSGIMGVDI